MKKYIIVVLMFFSQLFAFGQNPCVIYFETANSTDDYVDINVKANGFTDVVGFQMYINWDSLVLQYDTVLYTNSALEGIIYSSGGYLPAGYLSAQWLSSGYQSQTLADGTTLFTMRLNYVGNPGDQTDIILKDLPNNRKNKITYGYDEEYSINYDAYTVIIPGGNGGGDETGVGFDIDDVVASEGSTVCVPIYVDSFKNIGSLDLTICFDSDIISFVEVNDEQLTSQGTITSYFVSNDNVFKYSMAAGNNGVNIQDNGVLMELCFSVVGNDGDVAHLNFCGDTPIEITDFDDNELNYHSENGSVTVGDVDKKVTFIVSEEKAQKGETVCVDVTSKNFTNIQGLQYLIKWDSTVLKWNKFGSINNLGINSNDFNLIDGATGKISWNAAINPVTIADDTILYQLCYDVIGDCNDSSAITIFGDPSSSYNAIEVIDGDNNLLPHEEIPGKVNIQCLIEITEFAVNNVTCNGYSDGSIYITLNVLTESCNFSWIKDGVQIGTSQNINGLSAGTYKVIITDKNDPSIKTEQTFQVTEPDPMVINADITPVSCDKNGSIKLTVTGNNPPYTYEWTPSSIGNVDFATELAEGDYSVTVKDSKGCPPANKNMKVGSSVEDFKVKYTINDITCKDANDGEITLKPEGGCEPYTVNWEDGLTTLTRTNLAAAEYKVTITDSKGTKKIFKLNITNPEKELTISGVVHEGTPASIDITVAGGEGNKTFEWTGPNGFTSTNKNLTDLYDKGTYTVTVTDERGCVKTASFEVKGIIDPISINLSVIVKGNNGYGVKCNGDCNGTIAANINANAPWEVYLDDQKITLPYNKLCAGTYTLKVVDREGKTVDTTFTITEPDPIEIEVDEIGCVNQGKEDGSIKINVTGGVPDYEYDWGITGEDSDYIENLPKGKYTVVVTDANGCEATSEDINVTDCDRSDCYTGSLLITPNGDDFNEYFSIKCADDFESNELHIYDRLGNEVYAVRNYDGTWTGLDKFDKPLPEDSYMWVFIGVKGNEKSIHKGTVTILRK